jgi:hypothetical protein
MKKLLWLLLLLGAYAIPPAQAATPLVVYCVSASNIPCNTISNPGNGTQGDPAWLFSGKINTNFGFVAPLWNLTNSTLAGESSTGSFGQINLGTNLAMVGNTLNASGGGVPGGSFFSIQYNNSGVFGGLLPGATGTYCLTWASLSAAPTITACPGGGTVTSVNTTVPSPLSSSGCSYSSSGTCAITWATGLTGDQVLATPCNTTGTVSLRVLCSQDIPNNAANTTGTATTATNLAGGAQYELPYQNAAGTTVFTPAATTAGTSPVFNGSGFVWQAAAGSVNPCANANYVAYYASSGTVVSCAPLGNALTFNGGVLNVASLVNPQTGTTYAVSTSDNSKLITRTNAANMGDTIVAATTAGYGSGFAFDYGCYGAGVCTLTPTTSTIGGLAALVVPPNQYCSVVSDGTNYQLSACQPLVTDNVGGGGTSITPSCAIDNEDNYGAMTATAGTFTVNAPTGCVAFEGQRLRLHLKFTNAQTYSWNTAFVGGTTALPTTSTGSSKGDWIGFLYDSINSKWDYVATATGF